MTKHFKKSTSVKKTRKSKKMYGGDPQNLRPGSGDNIAAAVANQGRGQGSATAATAANAGLPANPSQRTSANAGPPANPSQRTSASSTQGSIEVDPELLNDKNFSKTLLKMVNVNSNRAMGKQENLYILEEMEKKLQDEIPNNNVNLGIQPSNTLEKKVEKNRILVAKAALELVKAKKNYIEERQNENNNVKKQEIKVKIIETETKYKLALENLDISVRDLTIKNSEAGLIGNNQRLTNNSTRKAAIQRVNAKGLPGDNRAQSIAENIFGTNTSNAKKKSKTLEKNSFNEDAYLQIRDTFIKNEATGREYKGDKSQDLQDLDYNCKQLLNEIYETKFTDDAFGLRNWKSLISDDQIRMTTIKVIIIEVMRAYSYNLFPLNKTNEGPKLVKEIYIAYNKIFFNPEKYMKKTGNCKNKKYGEKSLEDPYEDPILLGTIIGLILKKSVNKGIITGKNDTIELGCLELTPQNLEELLKEYDLKWEGKQRELLLIGSIMRIFGVSNLGFRQLGSVICGLYTSAKNFVTENVEFNNMQDGILKRLLQPLSGKPRWFVAIGIPLGAIGLTILLLIGSLGFALMKLGALMKSIINSEFVKGIIQGIEDYINKDHTITISPRRVLRNALKINKIGDNEKTKKWKTMTLYILGLTFNNCNEIITEMDSMKYDLFRSLLELYDLNDKVSKTSLESIKAHRDKFISIVENYDKTNAKAIASTTNTLQELVPKSSQVSSLKPMQNASIELKNKFDNIYDLVKQFYILHNKSKDLCNYKDTNNPENQLIKAKIMNNFTLLKYLTKHFSGKTKKYKLPTPSEDDFSDIYTLFSLLTKALFAKSEKKTSFVSNVLSDRKVNECTVLYFKNKAFRDRIINGVDEKFNKLTEQSTENEVRLKENPQSISYLNVSNSATEGDFEDKENWERYKNRKQEKDKYLKEIDPSLFSSINKVRQKRKDERKGATSQQSRAQSSASSSAPSSAPSSVQEARPGYKSFGNTVTGWIGRVRRVRRGQQPKTNNSPRDNRFGSPVVGDQQAQQGGGNKKNYQKKLPKKPKKTTNRK